MKLRFGRIECLEKRNGRKRRCRTVGFPICFDTGSVVAQKVEERLSVLPGRGKHLVLLTTF